MLTATEYFEKVAKLTEADKAFFASATGMAAGGAVGGVAGYIGKRDTDQKKNRIGQAALAGAASGGALGYKHSRTARGALTGATAGAVNTALAYGIGRAWAHKPKSKKNKKGKK